MPRPCQKRRESTSANRRSRPNPKPSGPPPIRHKKKQKAIHNARRGRGRGGGRGGGPSRNQRSGDGMAANQDYISFGSTPNNFSVLNGAGSRHDPIDIDEDSFEDGQITDSDSDSDGEDSDSDMGDAGAMTINVQVEQGQRIRARRAEVMFPMGQAIAIYKRMYLSGFPLFRPGGVRFGSAQATQMLSIPTRGPQANAAPSQYSGLAFSSDTVGSNTHSRFDEPYSNSSSNISPASASTSRQPSTSTATSTSTTGRDYVFNWGIHSGKHFTQVPEQYLRTIAGNPLLYDTHPGFKEALDYHRPGLRRPNPPAPSRQVAKQPRAPAQAPSRGEYSRGEPVQVPSRGGPVQVPTRGGRSQAAVQAPAREPVQAPTRGGRGQGEPVQAPTRGGRNQGSRAPTRPRARKSWTTYTFPRGAHMDKKLNEVPANYLKTLEGMEHVMTNWTGLREALDDYYAKTGKQQR